MRLLFRFKNEIGNPKPNQALLNSGEPNYVADVARFRANYLSLSHSNSSLVRLRIRTFASDLLIANSIHQQRADHQLHHVVHQNR